MTEASTDTNGALRVRNEFGAALVQVDLSGNSPRLMITDLHTQTSILLDPLELCALSACSHADLAPFMEALRMPGGQQSQEEPW